MFMRDRGLCFSCNVFYLVFLFFLRHDLPVTTANTELVTLTRLASISPRSTASVSWTLELNAWATISGFLVLIFSVILKWGGKQFLYRWYLKELLQLTFSMHTDHTHMYPYRSSVSSNNTCLLRNKCIGAASSGWKWTFLYFAWEKGWILTWRLNPNFTWRWVLNLKFRFGSDLGKIQADVTGCRANLFYSHRRGPERVFANVSLYFMQCNEGVGKLQAVLSDSAFAAAQLRFIWLNEVSSVSECIFQILLTNVIRKACLYDLWTFKEPKIAKSWRDFFLIAMSFKNKSIYLYGFYASVITINF